MSEELGINVKRSEDFSKWYLEVVRKGGFVDQRSPVKGFDVIMPWGYAIWEMLQKEFDSMIKEFGVRNYYFPSLIPERLLKKEEDHLKGFKAETFMVTHAGGKKLEEKLAIRPTSETIIYYMFSLWIRSYKDLPLKVNQWCNVLRFDTKVTKPFLRGREFLWQEGHTAHATEEDAKNIIEQIVELYSRIYKMLAISPLILIRPKSDTFAGADYSVVFDTPVQDGKVAQGPGTHMLGQNFSKPFSVQFLDDSGKKQYAWQTSWGMTTRQIGILVAHHGDDKGAILPPKTAPIQVVIVPILFKNKEEPVKNKSKEVEEKLKKLGLRVHLDNRNQTAGYKFNEWELRGVPLRIEIGPKDMEAGEVTTVSRFGEKSRIKFDDLEDVKKLLAHIQNELAIRSEKFLLGSIRDVRNMTELKKMSKAGGFFRGNWCSSADCEASIKADSGGFEIRGMLYGKEEKPFSHCLHCGKDAKHVVYIARAY